MVIIQASTLPGGPGVVGQGFLSQVALETQDIWGFRTKLGSPPLGFCRGSIENLM